MQVRKLLVVAVLALCALGSGAAQAAPIIDFQRGSAPIGVIQYPGGGAGLTGSTGIGTMIASNVPNSGQFGVVGGTLSFTTGNLVSFNAGTSTYTFGGGGAITITGAIPSLGINSAVTLLSGSFLGATVSPGPGATGLPLTSPDVVVSLLVGPDSKNAALLSALGIPNVINWNFNGFITGRNRDTGLMNGGTFSFNGGGTPIGAFQPGPSGGVQITNTGVPIPEPTSLLLLGSGLVGLGTAVRRRLRNRK